MSNFYITSHYELNNNHQVKTKPNTGELEGMKFQCFWISLLDHLHQNGNNYLTLRMLRTQAGLGPDTEQIMFDNAYLVNEKPIFYNAAEQIAKIYELTIKIHTTTRNGNIVSPRATIGSGPNIVHIAQFGEHHFELIDTIDGSNFVPAVLVNGNLTKELDDPNKKNIYLVLSENQGLLQIINDQITIHYFAYNEELKAKIDLLSTIDLSSDEKAVFIMQYDDIINNIVTEINKTEQKKYRLEEENSSLMLLISEYEKM